MNETDDDFRLFYDQIYAPVLLPAEEAIDDMAHLKDTVPKKEIRQKYFDSTCYFFSASSSTPQ